MAGRPLAEQELVVHLFASLTQNDADRVQGAVRDIWNSCRDRLGMTDPIGGPLRIPVEFPDDDIRVEAEREVLAAQQSPGGDRQSILRREGEILNLSVMLSDPGIARQQRSLWRSRRRGGDTAVGSTWQRLERLWSATVQARSGSLLGETRLFLGSLRTRADRIEAATGVGHSLVALLPPDDSVDSWWDEGITVPEGFALWETSPRSKGRARRCIVVLAPAGRDRDVSAWVWSNGRPDLPPLGRYLMNAAQVRYEQRVRDGSERPEQLIGRLHATVNDLRGVLADQFEDIDGTRRLDKALDALTGVELDLRESLDAIRSMRAAIDAAGHNMTMALASGPSPEGRHGIIHDDLELVSWLDTRLGEDERRLVTSVDNATRTRDILGPTARRGAVRGHEEPLPLRGSVDIDAIPLNRKVFLIYGRDDDFRWNMENFLRALGVWPLDWEQVAATTGSASPSLDEAAATAIDPAHATAVVALLTPDDVAYLHPDLHEQNEPDYETTPTGQPRPNVLYELGIARKAFPDKTLIVRVGSVRRITDLDGLNTVNYNSETIGSDGGQGVRNKIAIRLQRAGCEVNTKNNAWLDKRLFADLAAYTRRPPKAQNNPP